MAIKLEPKLANFKKMLNEVSSFNRNFPYIRFVSPYTITCKGEIFRSFITLDDTEEPLISKKEFEEIKKYMFSINGCLELIEKIRTESESYTDFISLLESNILSKDELDNIEDITEKKRDLKIYNDKSNFGINSRNIFLSLEELFKLGDKGLLKDSIYNCSVLNPLDFKNNLTESNQFIVDYKNHSFSVKLLPNYLGRLVKDTKSFKIKSLSLINIESVIDKYLKDNPDFKFNFKNQNSSFVCFEIINHKNIISKFYGYAVEQKV